MRGAPISPAAAAAAYADIATNCRVVDGDTLHCDGGRIRLLGIDAPELPGHCSANRDCAPGDPFASTESLEQGLGDGASVRIERVGTDRYGRTLAMVLGRGGDLSCWQLAHNQAIYKPRWDNGGRVARACRL
jgi:endonuclease YncB( thermonuclease family)